MHHRRSSIYAELCSPDSVILRASWVPNLPQQLLGDPQGAEFLGAAYSAGLYGLKQDPQKAEQWFTLEKQLRQKRR